MSFEPQASSYKPQAKRDKKTSVTFYKSGCLFLFMEEEKEQQVVDVAFRG